MKTLKLLFVSIFLLIINGNSFSQCNHLIIDNLISTQIGTTVNLDVYLKSSDSIYTASILTCKKQDDGSTILAFISGDVVSFSGLELENTYYLLALNSCDELDTLGEFNTNTSYGGACITAHLSTKAVLGFIDEAGAYLEFIPYDKYNATQPIQAYYKIKGGLILTAISLVDNSAILSGLVKDSVYEIHALNSCDEIVQIDEIRTYKDRGEPIKVSTALYEDLENWALNHENLSLVEFLFDSSNVNFREKVYYTIKFYDYMEDSLWLHHHQLHDAFLDNALVTMSTEDMMDDIWDWKPDVDGNWPVPDSCRCKYTMELLPHGYKRYKNFSSKEYTQDSLNHSKQYFNENGNTYSHFKEERMGPAKRHRFHIQADRAHWSSATFPGEVYRDYANYNNDFNYSQAFTSNKFFLICTGVQHDLPKRCECSKDFTVDYEYNSLQVANASKLSNNGGNRSSIKIEDWAFLLYKEGTKMELWDVGTKGTIAQCATTVDTDAKKKTLELGRTLVNLIGNKDSLGSERYKDSLYAVSILAAVDTGFTYSNCGGRTNNLTLLDGTKQFTLKSNIPSTVILFSMYDIEAYAKRRAEATGDIISDYNLTIYHTLSSSNNEVKYCCSKKLGIYDLFGFNPSSVSLASSKSIIDHQFSSYNSIAGWTPWDAPYNNISKVNYHFDLFTGPSYNNCEEVIISAPNVVKKKEILKEIFEFKTKENQIKISNEEKEAFNFEVFDALGRKIDCGFGIEGIGEVTLKVENKGQPLFIKITKNGKSQVLKIIMI